MSKIKYTKDITDKAIEMRLNGFSIPEITDKTGMGKPSLQKLFRINSIKLNENQKAKNLARRWLGHESTVDGHKICSKCRTNKLLEEFHINNGRNAGVTSSCRICYKEFYQKNAEIIKERARKYGQDNKEIKSYKAKMRYKLLKKSYIEKASKWAKANPEKVKEISRTYGKRTQPAKNARTALYRALKINATPKWLSEHQIDEIQRMYENCPKGFHVDHMVPLRGENVSGLHVPWNLQYLPATENMSKGNKF